MKGLRTFTDVWRPLTGLHVTSTTLISTNLATIFQRTDSSRTWEEVPEDENIFERLGIPEQERKFLAGVEAQFDSEAAYSRMKDDLVKEGVILWVLPRGLQHRNISSLVW